MIVDLKESLLSIDELQRLSEVCINLEDRQKIELVISYRKMQPETSYDCRGKELRMVPKVCDTGGGTRVMRSTRSVS